MKKFNELREQYLEEKLKASDPAGTYIHDFVHSDNPKFAGKSKAKRIQMALAASYAAKGKSRNEEVGQQDEGILGAIGKAVGGAVKTVASAGRSLASDVAKPIVQNTVPKSIQTTGSSSTTNSNTNTSTKPAKPVKLKTEETEQIDELKKSTLGSYVKKATAGMSGIAINAHQAGGASPGSKERKTFLAKANKRIAGVDKAINRLSK